ncbi:hypothetical protein E4U12_001130 [Claviceps purpurea]|nr:hypothetical protein E4U12_001130 [Claviceps purpurea]
MPPIPNMPPVTPHGTKERNKCHATKTLDHFMDLRRPIVTGPTYADKTSEANKLDPGEPPEHLEALGPLIPLEEWLIARVHTRMQAMTYRGAQYKYRGHHQLPQERADHAPPPARAATTARYSHLAASQPNRSAEHDQSFRTQLRIRHPVVTAWPRHLQANHRRYSDVTIDEDALTQLPDDGDVNAELQTQEVAPDDLEILVADIENDDLGYDVSVIPDLKA